MEKKLSANFLVVSGMLIIALVFLYVSWHSSRREVDHRTLAEKVKSCLGTDVTNLQSSLTWTPVTTNLEPFVLTYSMPLTVDAASYSYYPEDGFGKFRMLYLLDNGAEVSGYEINRQTNGTYFVKLNTLFATYGSHTLQVRLMFPTRGSYDTAEVFGSKLEITVTNLLQWDYEITGFGRWSDFQAKLQVPSADYSIFIYDTNTTLVKRIDGHRSEEHTS